MKTHIILRVLVYVVLFYIAIPVALSMLNPNRRCGTGDGIAIIFWEFIFYIIWAILLLVEAFFLHKKGLKKKRNANFIMLFILPTIILILIIFFWIKNYID